MAHQRWCSSGVGWQQQRRWAGRSGSGIDEAPEGGENGAEHGSAVVGRTRRHRFSAGMSSGLNRAAQERHRRAWIQVRCRDEMVSVGGDKKDVGASSLWNEGFVRGDLGGRRWYGGVARREHRW